MPRIVAAIAFAALMVLTGCGTGTGDLSQTEGGAGGTATIAVAPGRPGADDSGGETVRGNPAGSNGSGQGTAKGVPIDLGTYLFGPGPVDTVVTIMRDRFAVNCAAADPALPPDCVQVVVQELSEQPAPECLDTYDPDRVGYLSFVRMSPSPPSTGDPPQSIESGSTLVVYAQACEYVEPTTTTESAEPSTDVVEPTETEPTETEPTESVPSVTVPTESVAVPG